MMLTQLHNLLPDSGRALKYYGHKRVVVLNGGLAKWQSEGRPLVESIPVYQAATFTPAVQVRLRATALEVLSHLGLGGCSIDRCA